MRDFLRRLWIALRQRPTDSRKPGKVTFVEEPETDWNAIVTFPESTTPPKKHE
jgi:hypothetical protein